MAENKKISEFEAREIENLDGSEYLGGYAGTSEKTNIKVSLADLINNTSKVVKNSSYVQQVAWVDGVNGNDATAEVNSQELQFKTIKAAIDSLTAAICTVRIGVGDYHCPEEILSNINSGVQSLTIESHATSITASADFVKANQATLYDFTFLGANTDISAGNFGFAIEGSNIYSLKLVANNISGGVSGLVLIHPGFNDIVINGSISGGLNAGSGYALTIRGAMITNIFVRENIMCSGNNQYAAVLKIRDVRGQLNIIWGGDLNASNLVHTSSNAVDISDNNIGSVINLSGNIIDSRENSTQPAIKAVHHFTNLSFTGNVNLSRGRLIDMSGNSAYPATLNLNGNFKTEDGGIVYKAGNRPTDLYLNINAEYTTNAFTLSGIINLYLNGKVKNTAAASPLFHYPASIPGDAKVYIDDLEFTGFDENTPLGTEGAYTGTLNIVVNGAFRTNSTADIPDHLNITWLKDLTVNTEDENFVRDDGSIAFSAPQPGEDPESRKHLMTKRFFAKTLRKECDEPEKWELRNVGEENLINIKSNGKTFIAASTKGKIYRSTDKGATFQEIQVDTNILIQGAIACQGEKWFIISSLSENCRLYKSEDDGITWSVVSNISLPHGAYYTITDLAVYGDKMIATIRQGKMVISSIDEGANWNILDVPNNGWECVDVDDNGVWMIVASSGINTVVRSTNGVDFTPISIPPTSISASKCIRYIGNNTWVLIAYSNVGITGKILRSTDGGITFTTIDPPEYNLYEGLATDRHGSVIAVASTGNYRIIRSDDYAKTWKAELAPAQNSWNKIATDDEGNWIGVAKDGDSRIMVFKEQLCINRESSSNFPTSKSIIYGGFEWSGTGLIFQGSEIKYNYYGDTGIVAPTNKTLDDGEAEDRYDIIAVNVETNSIEVIKGTASNDPIFPQIPESLIAIQAVRVNAHSTTPEVIQYIVYRNNVEWVLSTLGSITGTIVSNATDNPWIGTYHIRVANCDRNAIAVLTAQSGSIHYVDYPLLTLRIRVKSALPQTAYLVIRNRRNGNNSGSAINLNGLGFNPTLQNSWQLIAVPTQMFNSAWGNSLSLQMISHNASLQMSWDVDNVVFSQGETPALPEPPNTQSLAEVLETGNTTGQNDIVLSHGTAIDASNLGFNQTLVKLPNGAKIDHLGMGILKMHLTALEVLSLPGKYLLRTQDNGLLIGDQTTGGTLWLQGAGGGFAQRALDITGNRREDKPDGDIDWRAGAEQDGFAMVWDDGEKKWKPRELGGNLILTSPDSTRWRITVDNNGDLITTAL